MNYFLLLGLVLFVYMSFWFLISLIQKRNDVADVAWGLGFVLIAWTAFFVADATSVRVLLVNVLVSIWGLRLAWHIHARNKGKTEDYRYQAWRQEWGKYFFVRSYFQIYFLQGALLFIIALPVIIINVSAGESLGLFDIVGISIWLIGFFFEVVGDAQLASFIRIPQNKGKLFKGGLWRYTRHPNYFGEVTQWWGVWLLALCIPSGWLTIVGPLTITFLILKVSGVPLLEKKMENNPDFIEYKKRTSVFIPLPPRSIN